MHPRPPGRFHGGGGGGGGRYGGGGGGRYGGGGYGLPSGCLKRRAAYPSIQDDFRGDVASLPDYCNDFNAMHEAKSTLKGDKRIEFIDYLCEVIKRDNNLSDEPYSTMTTAFYSTARQQAEAFLKTIGKLK